MAGLYLVAKRDHCASNSRTGVRLQTEPGHGIYHDSTTWRYRFEPTGERATRVTESYEFSAPRWLQTMDTMLGRPKALRNGVHRTLANLKHAAESAAGNI